jgi:hypothetical protein
MGIFKVMGGVATALLQKDGEYVTKDGKKYWQAPDGSLHIGQVDDHNVEAKYYYKIDGKDVTILLNEQGVKNPSMKEVVEYYWSFQNEPGNMEGGGKTTNNPDVYGRKCGGTPSIPKVCPNTKL